MNADLTKAVLQILRERNGIITGNEIGTILDKGGIPRDELDNVLDDLLDSGRLKGERIQTAHGPRYLLSRYSEAHDRLHVDRTHIKTVNIQTAGIVMGSMNQNSTVGTMPFPRAELERILAGTSSIDTVREIDEELKKPQPRPNVVLSAIERLSKVAEIVNGGDTFFRWLNDPQIQAMIAHMRSIGFQ